MMKKPKKPMPLWAIWLISLIAILVWCGTHPEEGAKPAWPIKSAHQAAAQMARAWREIAERVVVPDSLRVATGALITGALTVSSGGGHRHPLVGTGAHAHDLS